MLELRAGACAARGFPAPISDTRWHALGPAYIQAPGGEVDVVPAQCHQLRGPEAVAVSDQDRRGVPTPRPICLAASMSRSTSRSVRYSRLRLPTVTFTEVPEFSLASFAKFVAEGMAANVHEARVVALEVGAEMIEKEAKRPIGTYDAGWQPLAESTKRDRVAKGFAEDEPLLRTGEMRDLRSPAQPPCVCPNHCTIVRCRNPHASLRVCATLVSKMRQERRAGWANGSQRAFSDVSGTCHSLH